MAQLVGQARRAGPVGESQLLGQRVQACHHVLQGADEVVLATQYARLIS
jgi:hypothetical protein